MDTLADIVARDQREKEPLVYSSASQPYTAHKFCTDAWKTANLFRYHGVGPGRPVAVADDPRPQALLAFLGASLLGSHAVFGLPPSEDARLVVGPAAAVEPLAAGPGQKRIAFADEPDDPDVIHFERAVWSENPTMPPTTPDPDATALAADAEHTHAALLAAAEEVVTALSLTDEDAVAVRTPLEHPGTLVAGLLAPLSAGAEILLPGADREATAAVDDADDARTVTPDSATP